MRILIACEYSGVVRDAFSNRGHDAWSCDLLPTESEQTIKENKHIKGDVLEILNDGWDMMIAHPPCTRLCNSGVSWLHRRNLWEDMEKGSAFFKTLLDSDINKICIENPIMHKYAVEIIGRRQSQIIQPWMFGHGETKATCLWLKTLPKLIPTNAVNGREQRLHRLPPSKDRWKIRSKTFPGIANAMADQWGGYDL